MDQNVTDESSPRPKLRFAISSLLLGTTIVALTIALIWTQLEVQRLKKDVQANRKLTVDEVAASIENRASIHPFPVKVRDVRYSPEKDAYRVRFEFTDVADKERYVTDVTLVGDGFGAYTGRIQNDRFLAPLNRTELWVGAETPSPLKR